MILVDTSAWVEFLRGTASPPGEEVDRLLDKELAITDPILMEVLIGARDEDHLRKLRGLLGRARMIRCGAGDYEVGARLYRLCRRGGETPRRLIDCVIAAVAIREEIPILHSDSDFEVIARYTELTIHVPG